MWGNHIQRVKFVINENIIEQATYFKYLGYCISEYKSDLEDKLQTYNKINGAGIIAGFKSPFIIAATKLLLFNLSNFRLSYFIVVSVQNVFS